jgi:hypothetical protein
MTARATMSAKASQLVALLGFACVGVMPLSAQIVGARDPLVEAREMRAYIDRLEHLSHLTFCQWRRGVRAD